MTVKLSAALAETLRGWKEQLPAAWQPALSGVRLATADVAADLKLDPWVPIYPVWHERGPYGAPKGAHTFRALQGITPQKVRVVIIGQDPYPDIAKATGQSFEQGNLRRFDGDTPLVSRSLRAIAMCAAADATGKEAYRAPGKGWRLLVRHIRGGTTQAPGATEFFAKTKRQGVLWLNTTLTISLFRSKPSHQLGHAACWKPVVDALLEHLVARRRPLVFALWGGWAKKLKPPLTLWAKQYDATELVRVAPATHPVTATFLTKGNPLSQINRQLEDLGGAPIRWF